MVKPKKTGESKQLEVQLKDLEARLKRALADYQNLERRVSEEKQILSNMYTKLIIEKFLPILDNLQSAQQHLNDEGLEMVIKQFNDTLTREGLSEIEAEGQIFDPKFHEAVESVEGPQDGKVARVINKGYKIDNMVIRPARVAVTKAKEESTESSENQNQEVLES